MSPSAPSPLSRLLDPHVGKHLIADEGEVVVDEVRRHPVAIAGWTAGLLPCILVLALMPLAGAGWWVLMLLGVAGALLCLYKIQSAHMDRFVITNMRVFRVYGIFSQHLATMPMSRILDIAVHKPFIGRLLGYGHFVFESAAQDQGLRDIRWVGRPDERDLTIQRVIQRSGLRSSMAPSGGGEGAAPGRTGQGVGGHGADGPGADGPGADGPGADGSDGT